MRAVVVYESMYGNTRAVAEAIGEGLRTVHEVDVVPVGRAAPELVAGAGLLVVGGPTHAHGMTRPSTRQGAVQDARKPGSGLSLEEGADGPGVREWLASLGHLGIPAAAFDTRVNAPAALTGRASKGISRALAHQGALVTAAPESFLVTWHNALEPGEEARARQWGQRLAARALARSG
ncbi:MAG TPA: flavodoxin domain-containing protein [Acidimicrobiia bacterium]|nr:flavodoxin domain-containing protein [Acidimicrobiia bacterium]